MKGVDKAILDRALDRCQSPTVKRIVGVERCCPLPFHPAWHRNVSEAVGDIKTVYSHFLDDAMDVRIAWSNFIPPLKAMIKQIHGVEDGVG